MGKVTSGFIIAACSVVIGWAGIAAYSHFQSQHRQYVLEKCQRDEKYRNANEHYKYSISLGPRTAWAAEAWASEAKKHLNKCLSKYNLQLKDTEQW